ncbi:MAG: hypothetical protein ACP5OA_03475 [Candidatus Woesearchaeota archaeon]
MKNEIVENYVKILQDDLIILQQDGDILGSDMLCKLIAFFEIKNVIGDRSVMKTEDDIETMFESQLKYMRALSDIYLFNGFDTKYEKTIQEITFLNNYKASSIKRLYTN